MANANAPILAFNRGRISQKALARVDLQRYAFSADVQTNLPPRVLGSMSFRPGWEHLFSTNGNAAAKYLDFIFSTTDTALPEITASGIRFSVSDAIITRKSVSSAVTNGAFASALDVAFSHVWQVDDTPTDNAFVDETTDANDAGAADWTLFTATEAIGDYAAFGYTAVFAQIRFDYVGGTAGVGGVVAWEYWDGSAWTALAGVVDDTSSFTTAVADNLDVRWTIPSDWAAKVINGSASLFWVRAKITTVYSTNPILDQGFIRASWTNADETGATSAIVSGDLSLIGTLFNAAIRRQQVAVAVADKSVEHGVTFDIKRGPVFIKIGAASGGESYVSERELGTGTYSFAFTPTGDFHIDLAGLAQAESLVNSVAVDTSGDFTLPSPYAVTDLDNLRWTQSADVLFIACNGFQQRRLERFDTTSKSWGVSLYEPNDGPFRGINISTTKLTPSALIGDITLTASRALFASTHVGALFSITSTGQTVAATVSSDNGTFTDDNSMRIVGVGDTRKFTIALVGTLSASTITLQRSLTVPGDWTDVSTFTATQAATDFDDDLDNQIVYYRIGCKSGDYGGADNVVMTLVSTSGGIKGIVRVTAFTTTTSVKAAVLSNLGGTGASRDWQEGSWSGFRGFPSAVAFYEGRLWWCGKGSFFGSISDGFDLFDEDFEGDAGPINRSIAAGPVDVINWLLPLQRLIAGTGGAEVSARSTSLDEPLTPSNFNLKDASTQGSAAVNPVKVDQNGIFLQSGQTRIFEVSLNFEANDYLPTDLTDIVPEIGEPKIVRMAVQRQPDTRLHCVRSDGTVGMLVREPANEVLAWIDIETRTGDSVEDVIVLPGTVEDAVYYAVKRSVNGSTVRYLEKWALESEAVGGTLNKQADSFAIFTNSGAAASVPAGTVSHLVGESVVVWADGLCLADSSGDIATFTVDADGGIAALTNRGSTYIATTGIVGLAFRGRFQSTKLAYASQLGTALNQRKRLSHLGLLLANTHAQGIKYGPDFDTLDELPLIDDEGAPVDLDKIHATYDKDMLEWPGGWGTDERMCLEMNAPRPATCLGVVVGLKETDKT